MTVIVDRGSRAYDIATALEVFEHRSAIGVPEMSVAVAATTEVVDLGGMLIRRDRSLAAATESDLLVIPVRREPLAAVDHRIVAAVRCGAVRAAAGSGSSVASLLTGAFVLGAAGLLDRLPCTTHWRWCDRLAERHPRARVVPNVLYAGAGAVWTSAGVSADSDLLIELVRRRRALAAAGIARSM